MPHPDPECLKCKGAGVLYPWQADLGKPDYARTVPCSCITASWQQYRQTEAFVRQAGLDAQPTFENLKPVDGMKRAVEAARRLADGTADFIWLVVWGGPGSGKTHLAQAAAKLAAQRGVIVIFRRMADLFADIRAAMADDTVEQLIRRVKEVTMLVLDDYGVEYGSEWEAAKLDEIMTARFAAQLCTMVTTNRDIADFPERLRSRFLDHEMSRAVHDSAPDYRPKK